MFYELTRNQDIQAKLHEEIMQKLPPGRPASKRHAFGCGLVPRVSQICNKVFYSIGGYRPNQNWGISCKGPYREIISRA